MGLFPITFVYFLKLLLGSFAYKYSDSHLWLVESCTLWALLYAFHADITVTEKPASFSHRLIYWEEAVGALLVASMKANFIIGCLFNLNPSLPPFQILFSALNALLLWGPLFLLFGSLIALPAILVGAVILVLLSKFKVGTIKRYQIILALVAIGALYSLIVYGLIYNGVVNPLFLIGAALAGFLVRLPYLPPVPGLLPVPRKTGPYEQGRKQEFHKAVWLVALGLTIAFAVHQTRSEQQQIQLGTTYDDNSILSQGIDPDYAPVFNIGDLAFQIPNKFLSFPWHSGEKPSEQHKNVQQTLCASEGAGAKTGHRVPKEGCLDTASRPSVLLHFSFHDISVAIESQSRVDVDVTLGYNQYYRFAEVSAKTFANQHDGRSVYTRVPSMDTERYAAFHDAYGGRIFINKTGTQPQKITCEIRDDLRVDRGHMRCSAIVSYLAERFPRKPTGEYPYTIDFAFNGAELDDAANIGAGVAKKLSTFIVPAK